jgi:hypothetical protein
VVDDNALNKSLFARTVDNMFKKLKRAQSPVYTFASDGGHPLLLSIVQSLVSFAVVDKLLVISGPEAVELFKKSLDDTIQGSATKPQDFDCVFMVDCATLFVSLSYVNFCPAQIVIEHTDSHYYENCQDRNGWSGGDAAHDGAAARAEGTGPCTHHRTLGQRG